MFIKHPSGDRLATRIMWGLSAVLLLGLLVCTIASFAPGVMGPARWAAIQVLDPFGQVFLRLLFFVIVPLVFSSLALGVVQLGRLDKLGPLAGRTFALFGFNMAVAVALGLVAMNVTSPGEHISTETRDMLLAEYRTNAETIQNRAAEQQAQGFTFARAVDMFMPRNIFAAVVGQSTSQLGEMLPLILLALLVGAAGTTLAQERRDGMQQVLETTTELMTRIVRWALLLAPFAVVAFLGSVVIKLGLEILEALIIFCLVVLVSLAVHMFGTMSLLLKVFTRRSPRQFFRAVRAVLVTAFSTSSSAATLPTSIQVTRDQLGVSPSTAGFVLPLGATMNMSVTGPLRRVRRAVCRAGLWCGPDHRDAVHHADPDCLERGGRGGGAGRIAAAHRWAAFHFWRAAGWHRARPRRRSPSRHGADHAQRRRRHRHRLHRRRAGAREERARGHRDRGLIPEKREEGGFAKEAKDAQGGRMNWNLGSQMFLRMGSHGDTEARR